MLRWDGMLGGRGIYLLLQRGRRRNRGGEGQQLGHLLTITNEMFMSVYPSKILSVYVTQHYMVFAI